MDSFTYNIIYRPDSIEDICAYQQVMEYEVSNIFRKKINDEEESDNQINSQDNEMTGLELSDNKNVLEFVSEHPGRKYIGLKKIKKIKIPILYTSPFCDIEELYLEEDENKVKNHTKILREGYALKALLLFLPFRSREDLIDTCDGTHWTRFNTAKN